MWSRGVTTGVSVRGRGPINALTVPAGTTVEEHDVVTDGDVLVGGQSTVTLGIRGRNVAVGERVRVEADIEAEGDCRIDTWGTVDGTVLVGEDAYLGERVTITGQLLVSGDLDIGDDVTIEEGFEANGWIVIRNPIPTIVFYFIVLSQLLRADETDAADELAAALADGDDVRDPLVIPRGAEVSDDAWRVSTPATVGDDCRLHGNLRAESIVVGERNDVFGSLRARDDIRVSDGTTIHGDVTSRSGTVTIEAGAHIRGDVAAGDLVVHEGAEVDGTLRARGEMKLVQSIPDASASTEDERGADPTDAHATTTTGETDANTETSPSSRDDTDDKAVASDDGDDDHDRNGSDRNDGDGSEPIEGGADRDGTDSDDTESDTDGDPASQNDGNLADVGEPTADGPTGSPPESGSPAAPTDELDETGASGDRHTEPASVIENAAAALGAGAQGDSASDDADEAVDAESNTVDKAVDAKSDADDEGMNDVWDGWPDHDEGDLAADAASDRLADTSGSLSSVIEEAEQSGGHGESPESAASSTESTDEAAEQTNEPDET